MPKRKKAEVTIVQGVAWEGDKIVGFHSTQGFCSDMLDKIVCGIRTFIFARIDSNNEDQECEIRAINAEVAFRLLTGDNSPYEAEWGDYRWFIAGLKDEESRTFCYERITKHKNVDLKPFLVLLK